MGAVDGRLDSVTLKEATDAWRPVRDKELSMLWTDERTTPRAAADGTAASEVCAEASAESSELSSPLVRNETTALDTLANSAADEARFGTLETLAWKDASAARRAVRLAAPFTPS